MRATPDLRNADTEDEAPLLAAIDRWCEKEVKPIAKDYDHADRYPAVVAALTDVAAHGGADDAFGFGLHRILDGLAVLVAQRV